MISSPNDEPDDAAADVCDEVRTDAYASAKEYLFDELGRIALLVKAYIIRRTVAATSHLSCVDLVTQTPFDREMRHSGSSCHQSWNDHLEEADEKQREIELRLAATPTHFKDSFPLIRLTEILKSDTKIQPRNHDPQTTRDEMRLLILQRDVLLLALLGYQFPVYRGAFSKLMTDDDSVPGCLSVGMAAEICQPRTDSVTDLLEMFHTDVPLLRDCYVALGDAGAEPSKRRLQIDPAIAGFLLETISDDLELLGLVTRYDESVPCDSLQVDEEVQKPLGGLMRHLEKKSAVILFHGPGGSPFITAARKVLSKAGRPTLLVADVSQAAGIPNWAEWTKRVYRLARLQDSAILWQGATAIIEGYRTDSRWQQLIFSGFDVPVFMTADASWDPEGVTKRRLSTFVRIEFPVPSREVRRQIWERQLEANRLLEIVNHEKATFELLTSFQFTEGQIRDAIVNARGLFITDSSKQRDVSGLLYAACRRISARGLVSFTQRIPPRKFGDGKNPLDAIVLAPEGRQQLHELNDRIQNMNAVYFDYGFGGSLNLGRGLIALFSGPSGTGKTMAATVLAGSRERDLYKVDMSAVVSKYVGETEKNLARVFSDAQSTNALLFFDEADAIFGKRGEVDKAQDRWANMEINYLLQRVEEFSGVVILATNLKQNIDEAFLRRVQVLIDFKSPDAKDRRKILAGMFPKDVIPPADVDLQAFCEQFDFTGGNLKNVAVDAAFRAIKDAAPSGAADKHEELTITIEHLVLAAAREYRKLSRPVSSSSFGRRFYDIVKKHLQLD